MLKNTFLTTLLFLSIAGFAQNMHKNLSDTNTTKQITQGIDKVLSKNQIKGLSVVILQNNQIAYSQTFGEKNAEKPEKLDNQSIMYAASFTKPLFSYLFLNLVDKGIFELDKPLHHYLKNPIDSFPKWAELAKYRDFQKITSRMILSHSSGLPILRFLYGDSLSLIAEPAKKFYYSNEGMNLLGFVVEEFTGKKLDNLANEFIFKPLYMTHTGMIWHPEFEQNYAVGHDKDGKVIGAEKRENARGAGSMVTTAEDYAKFLIHLANYPNISKKLKKEIFKPQIKIISSRGFGPRRDEISTKFNAIHLSWGLGVGLFKSNWGEAFFHSGQGNGWQNYFVIYPEQKIGVVLMSNSDNFEKSAAELLKICIGDTYSPLEWLGYLDK